MAFSWSDDDVELMINSALQYKAAKQFEGSDWETIRTKYDDIGRIMSRTDSSVNISKDRIAATMKKFGRVFVRLLIPEGDQEADKL